MSSMPPDGGFAPDPPKETFRCPNCGHQVEVGTPTCGNCGTILQSGLGASVPPPVGATGFRPGGVIVLTLVLALTVTAFVARNRIGDLFDSVGDAVEDATGGATHDPGSAGNGGANPGGGGNGGGGNGGGGGNNGGNNNGGSNGGNGGPNADGSFQRVPQVVAAIRAGGIPCTSSRVDAANAIVATGSCQSNGSHVQINLYFDPNAIAFAKDFYDDFAFASVHDANWWVSGETTLMRRIHAVLGGRFQQPS